MSSSVRAPGTRTPAPFVTEIESDTLPPGLDEDVIRFISAAQGRARRGPKSLDEVDPELLETYEKLGIPSKSRRLAGVAVDAVFDSVSVATTFKREAGRGRRDLLLHLRGGARAPGTGAQVPRQRRAAPTTSTRR
jgi:Fe-S cluster assembly scaffold protein SufB